MATPTTIEINGYALRELRKRSGLGVAELAAQVKVQRPYIAKIELGHSRRVSPKVFNALLTALVVEDRRALLANPHGVTDLERAAS
ncbi:MAG: XRE family transcriptional regulator [Dehalococcoidia bacterium]|nr:MAG: XRE family transcriptional regulator [Dehalococcoidia bacterium]